MGHQPGMESQSARAAADERRITVAIPTNGRPASLRNCLDRVRRHISPDCPALVLDSTPRGTDAAVMRGYADAYKQFPNVQRLRYEDNVPPGAARRILAEHVTTPYVLFLDDDLEIREGAFERMFGALEAGGFDIMSGAWMEDGSLRPLGFLFTTGTHEGRRLVLKYPIAAEAVPPEGVVQLDDVQASMLARRAIFDRVSFDDRYEFFFELYDFFFQCKQKGVRVGAHRGALLDHRPRPYHSKSSRFFQQRERDERRFVDKWGYVPLLASPPPGADAPLVRRMMTRAISHLPGRRSSGA